jgi:imidazoleglycerol-phosphate dehydratase
MTEREATVARETAETNVRVELNIDGSGQFQITTGIRMFDHLLSHLAQHGVFDIKISASGPDQHHVVDIGGRVYSVIEADFNEANIGDLDADLVRHFLVSLASEAKINLHAKVLSGINDHHKAEALFKALARALDSATRIDERILGRVPSTKEVIEG